MPTTEELHARARELVRVGAVDDATFDAMACVLARFQAAAIPGFRRLCAARGVDPEALAHANEIPAVPAEAFRLTDVATFDPALAAVTFRTSGTTAGARGTHRLRDPATYEAGAVAFGREWLARDLQEKVPVVVLGPSPEAAPDSSLGWMCAAFVRAFGEAATSRATWLVDGDVLDLGAFDERVAVAVARQQPVLVLATSFALVHFLDAVGDAIFRLPSGSRVMQTGGFKGKSREVAADELRADLARAFAIDRRSIVAEYGMTELTSQFYEKTLFEASPHGIYASPPWARVVPVDPESLLPMPPGEIGIAKIVDLLNVDSAVAVLTQDRVRTTPDGFELLGRMPGAPSRGCSIAIDELLGRSVGVSM